MPDEKASQQRFCSTSPNPASTQFVVQHKLGNSGVTDLLELAFIWQGELGDSPDSVGRQDGKDHDPESPFMEELIEIMLEGNEDPKKKAGCER